VASRSTQSLGVIMEDPRKVECATHGWQDESFVCRHIFESLHSGTPVGFHWPADSGQLHPDAWCSGCEEQRAAGDGEWSEELTKMLDIKLLCGACYERAKDIWQRGSKVSQ
jgi:hypothetical protein